MSVNLRSAPLLEPGSPVANSAMLQEQNLYLAAVGRGGVQKFRPRANANPACVVGKHVYSAWK